MKGKDQGFHGRGYQWVMRCIYSGERFPPNFLLAAVILAQADASRLGTAKMQSRVDEFLQDLLRRISHRLR
jgi:hypothetical protein